MQQLEFLVREHDLLRVEHTLELHAWHVAFAQDVVVVEELKQADAVLFHGDLHLIHYAAQ